MLETMYNTTGSEETKQLIGCLVSLDLAITKQSHLNEQHETHTAKNFREQRHVNKDRKLRLQETINSFNININRLEAQLMALEIQVKQEELRDNSHALQIKGLHDRARMLAEGGEWAEQEIAEMKENTEALQEEFDFLKLENERLREETVVMKKRNEEQIEDLKKEVKDLKERDDDREKRLAALEQLLRNKLESQ
jgi:chromosome segregation ATPase